MKNRSIALVIVLTLVTLGIYGLVWMVMTKEEMNQTYQAEIPTAWLIIIPFVGIYWIWRYSVGVEKATGQTAPVNFLLLFLLGIIGMAIIQSKFNAIATS